MDSPIRILLVDDDESFRQAIGRELKHMGFDVVAVESGQACLNCLRQALFDVTLLDIRMPGMEGIEVLETIQAEEIVTQVIMLSGHGTVENAVEAMKLGAYDYLIKPCPLDELEVIVHKACEKGRLLRQNAALQQEITRQAVAGDIVGQSPAIHSVLDIVARVAPSDSTVLICGESGVGKELVARAIHKTSLRAKAPFVVIDCTSLQENLLESELFGHERGAYTGATSLKHGLFEAAHSGTILLDEVSETSQGIQAKLLRALETGTFRRVGGNRSIHVDVRVLATTNRNLEQYVAEGHFRKDLFFRLNVVSLTVPPLRERREDIPLLVQHVVMRGQTGRQVNAVSEEAMSMLMNYTWPGNVRELQNVVERAVLLCKGKRILPEDLPDGLGRRTPVLPGGGAGWPSLKEAEREYIARVLEEVAGHRDKAARILGISERHLYRKIRNYSLRNKQDQEK